MVPICRAFNFGLPTDGCRKTQEFVCFTLKFACFSSKKKDLSTVQDYLAQNLVFLIDN